MAKEDRLSDLSIATICRDAGWTGFQIAHMTSIVLAENLGDPYTCVMVDHPESLSHGSVDFSLFAINTYWNGITDTATMTEFFLNVPKAAEFAKKIWDTRFRVKNGGYAEKCAAGYSAWNVYPVKSKAFLPRGIAAYESLG